SFCRGCR
ncbi:Hep/Hag repeat protein, partial [Haemophilus influenzae]